MKLYELKNIITKFAAATLVVGCASEHPNAPTPAAAKKKEEQQATSLKNLAYKSVKGSTKSKLTEAELDAVYEVFFVNQDTAEVNAAGELVESSIEEVDLNAPLGNIVSIIRDLAAIGNSARSGQNQAFSNKNETIYDRRVCLGATPVPQGGGTVTVKGDWSRQYKKTSTQEKNRILEVATLEGSSDMTGTAENCKHFAAWDSKASQLVKQWEMPDSPPYPTEGSDDEKHQEYEKLQQMRDKEIAKRELEMQKSRAENAYAIDGQLNAKTEFSVESKSYRDERKLIAKNFEDKMQGVQGRARAWSQASGKFTSLGFDSGKFALVSQAIEVKDFGLFVEMTAEQFVEARTVGKNNLLSNETNRQDMHDFMEDVTHCIGTVKVNSKEISCEAFTQILIDMSVDGQLGKVQ